MEQDRRQESLIERFIPDVRVRWILYWSFWILIAFLSAVRRNVFYPEEFGYPWLPLIRNKIGIWVIWGGFTLLIYRLSRRYPFKQPDWLKNGSILFMSSLIVVVSYLLIWTSWLYGISYPSEIDFIHLFRVALGREATFYFLSFWSIVALQQILRLVQQSYDEKIIQEQMKCELTSLSLERLRGQLQPHFLFNSLNAISSMVLRDKRDEAHESLTDLADLLRMSLNHSNDQFVTLAEEFAFSRRYMDLVAVRFPDHIEFDIEVDPKSLGAEVPSMLLQPLIENAVKYCSDAGSKNKLIKFRTICSSDNLQIIISNPAVGEELNITNSVGIGLSNTRERLFHLYKDKAVLDIQKQADGNVVVTISLPFTAPDSPQRTA